MIRTTLRSARVLAATVAITSSALLVPAAQAAQAGGLRNCVDITGPQSGQVGCWEDVWADGTQVRMTFSNTRFSGQTPRDLPPFYVLAPQGAIAQGSLPFGHDHVIRTAPAHNSGTFGVRMATYFVMCSADGMVSGRCVPTMSAVEGMGELPLAHTVDGHGLTSTTSIEAAAGSGVVQLFDIGAVIVGSVTGPR